MKMFIGESIAKICNLVIELVDNFRDLVLALIGEYEMRAMVFQAI